TATQGSDYTLAAGTLIFNPGEYQKSLPLTIIDDTAVDASFTETVQISLWSPSGAALWPGFAVFTYEIFDNDF
ncbi:MAG: hypothetical protein L0Y71_21525, partial [Gemmataceae bacterium]|nr:hypothetical protein [Gemmataceae bacterium]